MSKHNKLLLEMGETILTFQSIEEDVVTYKGERKGQEFLVTFNASSQSPSSEGLSIHLKETIYSLLDIEANELEDYLNECDDGETFLTIELI